MKYIKLFEDKDSPMKHLLSKGKDIEVVTEYKPKSTKHRTEVGKKNKDFLDKVEKWTKENGEEDNSKNNITESKMKYLHKFNEGSDKKISNDRVTQIITEMDTLTQVINDNMTKTKLITDELSGYTSKSSKNNNQIDDAFINFGSLNSKLVDLISTINAINVKLKDYTEHGASEIY